MDDTHFRAGQPKIGLLLESLWRPRLDRDRGNTPILSSPIGSFQEGDKNGGAAHSGAVCTNGW
jgi:hypothetical protein